MPRSYVVPLDEPKPGENLQFISVINFMLRNGVKMLVGGLVGALLLTLPSVFAPDSYTSTTTFITEGEQPAGRLLGGLSLPSTSGRGPEFTVELMKSPAILGPLVESRIEVGPGEPAQTLIERFAGSERNPQVAKEMAMSTVASMMGTKISLNGIVTLRVTASHPKLAAGIARGILEQIDEFNNNKRKSQASAERKFAEQRLAEITVEVREAEERQRLFLERNREISRSPALSLERERIGDDVGVKRGLRSSVMQAYEKAKMDEVRDSPRATVLAPPLPPTGPDRRVAKRYIVLGFFLGAMLVGFVAVALEYFKRIPTQPTPEANEFAALRSAWLDRVRKPVAAVTTAVRRSRDSTTLQ
jgi:uncharacterized protein involved in exopolysaccharide biosynthesis